MTQEIDRMLDFFLYEKGESITANGTEHIALIIDAVEKPTYYDDKIIRIKAAINTGDIIEYNGLTYLVISQVDKEKNSYRARMRKCSYSIAFNWSGSIKWFNCIEESKVFDIESGTYFSTSSGNICVTVQYNADTVNIDLNQRFYVTNQPFKVMGIDKSQEGLIKLSCTLTTVDTANDDVDNNIADRWKYETIHTYALTIDNGDAVNVLLNDTIQLNISATDNGTEISNPVVTFISSTPGIICVDNTGKVMGMELGQATVTASLTYHNMVSDSILITTVETESHSYTIDINGSTTIYLNKTQSYVAHFYDNGTEVYDKSAVWSISNQDRTTIPYATITSTTGNGATIKAASSSAYLNKYVVLKATLSDDEAVYKEFTVRLKSLI